MGKKTPKFHAKVIIHGLPTMDAETKLGVANWLEERAREIKELTNQDDYHKKCKMRMLK